MTPTDLFSSACISAELFPTELRIFLLLYFFQLNLTSKILHQFHFTSSLFSTYSSVQLSTWIGLILINSCPFPIFITLHLQSFFQLISNLKQCSLSELYKKKIQNCWPNIFLNTSFENSNTFWPLLSRYYSPWWVLSGKVIQFPHHFGWSWVCSNRYSR